MRRPARRYAIAQHVGRKIAGLQPIVVQRVKKTLSPSAGQVSPFWPQAPYQLATTLFIAAGGDVASPDLTVFSSRRTVHFHKFGPMAWTMVSGVAIAVNGLHE
jgi:hypothetical protein